MKALLNATNTTSRLTPLLRLHPFPALQFPLSHFKLNSLKFHKISNRRTMASSPSSSSSSSLSSCVKVKDKIDLTEKENQIFSRLLQVLHHFNLPTELRVAGGWVRDKLLGKDCHDIDIAIDNMMGKEFCEKINEYLSFAGEETHEIGVIDSNPDQSKHLETATMRMLGESIDFVNLRCEKYSEGSRIPTVEFGSAAQDADRRDLTINSLFYNINKKSVEDFTGRGLADLKAGKIVTPLPPKETFLDDPLRVLRAIRFGARFRFLLDEELKEAAASNEVRVAIGDKISRERIGKEIDLMIKDKQPVQAVTYICNLQLFWVVFTLPAKSEPAVSEGCDRLCVASVDAAWNLLELLGRTTFDDVQRRLYLYSALFLPLREVVYRDKKDKKVPVTNYIFRNSLKLTNSDAETVMSIHSASERFLLLIPSLRTLTESETVEAGKGGENFDVLLTSRTRILAGLLLREIKSLWRVASLISTLLYPIDFDHAEVSPDKQIELERRRNLFTAVETAIMKLGLENVWEMKPLVNGKDIMTVLQLKTGGPQVKEWQQKSLEWQLADPCRTSEQCIDWMRESLTKLS
ncbi:CCA tRNA nucleotidyltransferase, mitochondrial-like [Papaver somniferum]|uniref:CCA tRNA nucleotidyltransferase, mitochondrial-like n=1 Tax=Papaver somniferum TaxID=3469 RepID=UPI000E6FE53D|nr:CCA tRNA nucleotidyltransferase, mitochondrial-like [Papaver somniferum]